MTADEAVVTAVPDLTSLWKAKGLIHLLKPGRPNDCPPKLLLNQIGRTETRKSRPTNSPLRFKSSPPPVSFLMR